MSPEDHDRLLVELQRGVPLERRPFAALGERLGLSEQQVLEQGRALFDTGKARRFGAVFDVRRLGYRSALCAAFVPVEELEAAGAVVVPYESVTHCYHRGWPSELDPDGPGGPGTRTLPTLWFTVAGLAGDYEADLASIATALRPHETLVLPATRRFKIDVVFDPRTRDRSEVFPGRPRRTMPAVAEAHDAGLPVFDETERAVVRALQGALAVAPCPFDAAADGLGMPVEDLLARLRRWEADGVLRRVGVILRHRKIGFRANGMCVWPCEAPRALEAGRALAAFPEVTHCYERVAAARFPFRLYAMIHTGAWAEAIALFRRLGAAAGLSDGCVLFSLREFKKTSPKYFHREPIH